MTRTNYELPPKEVYYAFKHYFGEDLANFKDTIVMMATGRFSFDIIKFDEFCKKHFGYDEENGSLKAFIDGRFGENVSCFILDLLNFSIEKEAKND